MIDMSPEAVGRRLRECARTSDLRTEQRLSYKLDMSREGISRRLARVEALRRLCLELVKIGERNHLGRSRRQT
jgi:hypothetical protein